jgi:hypothetical protein
MPITETCTVNAGKFKIKPLLCQILFIDPSAVVSCFFKKTPIFGLTHLFFRAAYLGKRGGSKRTILARARVRARARDARPDVRAGETPSWTKNK